MLELLTDLLWVLGAGYAIELALHWDVLDDPEHLNRQKMADDQWVADLAAVRKGGHVNEQATL